MQYQIPHVESVKRNKIKIDVVDVVHRLAHDIDIAKRHC